MKYTTHAHKHTDPGGQLLFTATVIDSIIFNVHKIIKKAIEAAEQNCQAACLALEPDYEMSTLSNFVNHIQQIMDQDTINETIQSLMHTKKNVNSFIIAYTNIDNVFQNILKSILDYHKKEPLMRKKDTNEDKTTTEIRDFLYETQIKQEMKILQTLNEKFYTVLYELKKYAENDPDIGEQIKNIRSSDLVNALPDKHSNRNQQSYKSSIFNYLCSFFQPKKKDDNATSSKTYKP